MKKSMAKMLPLYALASMGAITPELGEDPRKRPVIHEPKRRIPPKGTKEYFFNIHGDFSTERMLKSECVFTCIASNDKNAKRKFQKWSDKNE